jgi:hypothetical protein
MGDKIQTPVFRVSFPQVFEPKSFSGGEPKYSIVMIFDKKQDLREMRRILAEAATEKFGAKKPANLRDAFRDGKEKENLQGYGEGVVFTTASSKSRPGLVDQNVQQIIDRNDFYAGCYARATVNAFAYDTNGNRGVSFGLNNIQKVRDGERFDGRTAAEDDFEAVDVVGEATEGDKSFLD